MACRICSLLLRNRTPRPSYKYNLESGQSEARTETLDEQIHSLEEGHRDILLPRQPDRIPDNSVSLKGPHIESIRHHGRLDPGKPFLPYTADLAIDQRLVDFLVAASPRDASDLEHDVADE